MKNKKILKFIVKILFFTLIIFLVYYIFLLRPKYALPAALLDAEELLAKNRANLVLNRTAFMNIAKLKPDSPTLNQKRAELYKNLKETHAAGSDILKNYPLELKKLCCIFGESARFYKNELKTAMSALSQKTENFYPKQKNLIDAISSLDSISAGIFLSDPRLSLQGLNIISDKDKLIARANTAKTMLEKTKRELESFEIKNSGIDKLKTKIDETTKAVDGFLTALGNNYFQSADYWQKKIYPQFDELKKLALEANLEIIKSQDSVKMLTEQTNLILEYDYLVKKISAYRQLAGKK